MPVTSVRAEDIDSYPPNIRAMMKKPSPAAQALGLSIEGFDAEAGIAELAFEAGETLCNKWGGLQGGMVAAMLDEALSHAAGLTLEWGQICPTLEMKVSYLEAARPGRLRARGAMVKRGRSVGFAEAVLTDAEGCTLATATGTFTFVTLKKKD